MTDLTKDWKDGKLSAGWYYVKFPDTEVEICGFYKLSVFRLCADTNEIKILAKVPDYTAWQNLWNTADMEHKANNKLLEDVERLEKENKELKKQVNHLSKTQARQFVDNQKLQVKAEKAKDVVDIEAARKIKELERELKKMREDLYAIANNVNPKFDVKKYTQADLSAKFRKYLNGD